MNQEIEKSISDYKDKPEIDGYSLSDEDVANLMEGYAAGSVASFFAIMAKTGYSFSHLDSGWWIIDGGMCVAEQLTGDEFVAFLIDYDINENK